MIDSWAQFTDFFAMGLGVGFIAGLSSLAVVTVRNSLRNGFKRAMSI